MNTVSRKQTLSNSWKEIDGYRTIVLLHERKKMKHFLATAVEATPRGAGGRISTRRRDPIESAVKASKVINEWVVCV